MATGGTGDVLTGMLAGLTAEFGTKDWERVLGLGVYLHGLAGDLAAEYVGQAPLVASDVDRSAARSFGAALVENGNMPATEFVSSSPEETVEIGRELAKRLARAGSRVPVRRSGQRQDDHGQGHYQRPGRGAGGRRHQPHLYAGARLSQPCPRSTTWIFTASRASAIWRSLGLEDAFAEPGVVIIEWAERFTLRTRLAPGGCQLRARRRGQAAHQHHPS